MSDLFLGKLTSIDQALREIRSGYHVVASMAAAEPQALLQSLGDHCRNLSNVTLSCANPSRDYSCFNAPDLQERLEIQVMFLTPKVRKLQGQGRVHYIPQHLSQWSRNLTRDRAVDVYWGTCSTPDVHGFVSLGTGGCYEPEIIRSAKCVVLEVNRNVPVSHGATRIPVEWVNHFISHDAELPSIGRPEPSPEDHKIAAYVAELIPHGATLQFGIGGIPNALGAALAKHKDLGVHTEMINDTLMDLHHQGAITGRMKTLWPGKIVGSFVYGTPELYRFIDHNPAVELQPSSIVNDPAVIGQNHLMFSVNTAVELDLTGQVCSESVGHIELSGVGGAHETHIGAQRSPGGRGIIAIRSACEGPNASSKIVFELKPGAKVSVSRNDIDTVVTEYGIARLAGLSVSRRVKALVGIAHPKFRDELLRQAVKNNYI